MNRCLLCLLAGLCAGLILIGCSGGADPVIPAENPDPELTRDTVSSVSHTHLWGLYDVYVDIEEMEVTALPSRSVMFTSNVVNFINNNPSNLSFHINDVETTPDWIGIYTSITVGHPFPGFPQYNGYDVRGIFMGNGSASMAYNPDLVYPVKGTDQMVLPNHWNGLGYPDGYTRWFNYSEFSEGGMPLFQYTQGHFATSGFSGSATLNPYVYFADGLDKYDYLFEWLDSHPGQHGQFASGSLNSRYYYLRFPHTDGIYYGYAIIADWGGIEPEFHPSNAPEAVACRVDDNSNVYYVSPTDNGGNLVLDISVWDWDSSVESVVMEDYRVFIESTVLSGVYEFDSSDMTPVDGSENYSTYHVEIPADDVTGVDDNEYWVIVEQQGLDYTNDFGTPNLAGTDTLAAFFRYDLDVSDNPGNTPPVIIDITDDIEPDGLNTALTDEDIAVTYIVDFTDPDTGQTHTIDWYIENSGTGAPTDPPDAMPYDWSLKEIGDYEIWVKVDDGYGAVLGGPWVVSKAVYGWVRTWGAGNQDRGYGVVVDSQGYIYVAGNFYSTVDFDPGPGTEEYNSGGNRDSFVSKFDSAGNFYWARTWGGSESFGGGASDITVDSSDNVIISGYFFGTDVDFDPDPAGDDLHTSVGSQDAYVTVFDPDGDHLWANTWGGTHEYGDNCMGVDVDSFDNIYVAGQFLDTVDFDPDPVDTDPHTAVGYYDFYVSSFDSTGDFRWANTFGGDLYDFAFGCEVDSLNNVCVAGRFNNLLDFDPGPGDETHDEDAEGNMYLAKYDSDGDFVWVKVFGRGDAFRIAFDSNDNVFLSGVWGGASQFDPDNLTELRIANGARDCYLSKFSSTGLFQWVQTWDSIAITDITSGYIGHHVTIDSSDNIYTTGHFTGTADLDPDPVDTDDHVSNGLRDTFLSRFDSSGDLAWARSWGGESTDDGAGIAVDNDSGNIYGTGWFFGTVDFNPGPDIEERTALGSLDAFLIQLKPDGYW